MTPEEFKDIAPYDDADFKDRMATLVVEPGFKHAVTYAMPMVDYDAFAQQLTAITSKEEFQLKVMAPFLEMLAQKTTSGVSIDGLENTNPSDVYTYISNHRDIVLDATLLNLCLLKHHYPTTEIALGDNLLIYEWIERLVKLNGGFIVKRNLPMIRAFEAARQLSAYIHYCLTQKHKSIWIAQREGRAKDSNDMTQESVIKMMALSGGKDVVDALRQLNICPVTISYEYDPNDYLKATEFLNRHRNPDYVKTEHDDLLSMETGLMGFKGHVHYHVSPIVNSVLDSMEGVTDRNEIFAAVVSAIDESIHSGYKLFASNYISYDRLNGTTRFAHEYTAEQAAAFDAYLDGQLAKVRIADVTEQEREFMLTNIYKMYSNPLINKYRAEGREI